MHTPKRPLHFHWSWEVWGLRSASHSVPFRSCFVQVSGRPSRFSAFRRTPWDRTCRLEPQPLRVLLLRCLRLPLPLTTRTCRCGRPLDVLGHHRSACAVVGRLGCRGFPLENAAARVCREAGGRVRTNAFLRDMDLGPINPLDARRLEVVVDGLPLFGGAQLAVDTTLVCPLTRDGAAKPRAATVSGACHEVARRAERGTLPRTCGESGQSALCCLGWRSGWSILVGNGSILSGPRQREGP